MANDTMIRDSATHPEQRPPLSTLHKAKFAFFIASFLSLAFSVALWALGHETQAIFVGLWVPSIHSLGTLVLTGEEPR